jgi:hypothetical protein
MLSDKAIHELKTAWLPNITDIGLEYLARLLETGSPYLIRRAWASDFADHSPEFDIADAAIGCIATHAGWHHPATLRMHGNAGHTWLTTIAGVESEYSAVLQEWDGDAPVEAELAYILRQEQRRRGATTGNIGRPARVCTMPPSEAPGDPLSPSPGCGSNVRSSWLPAQGVSRERGLSQTVSAGVSWIAKLLLRS